MRGARLETVRAHLTGSSSCKPSAGNPSGCPMAPRQVCHDAPEVRTRIIDLVRVVVARACFSPLPPHRPPWRRLPPGSAYTPKRRPHSAVLCAQCVGIDPCHATERPRGRPCTTRPAAHTPLPHTPSRAHGGLRSGMGSTPNPGRLRRPQAPTAGANRRRRLQSMNAA